MAFSKKKGGTKSAGKGSGGGKKDYDESNRGVLFVNDKDGNEARPDYTGKVVVKLEDYEADETGNILVRLAGWMNNSEKVGDYIAISASPPQQK